MHFIVLSLLRFFSESRNHENSFFWSYNGQRRRRSHSQNLLKSRAKLVKIIRIIKYVPVVENKILKVLEKSTIHL